MVNKILLQSSLVCSLILTLFLLIHDLPIVFIFTMSCGSISSILNHGFTNFYFKVFDRSIMIIGFIVNGLYINYFIHELDYILAWCSMISAVLLYLITVVIKLNSTNLIHIMAHGCIVFTHMLISIHLHGKCNKN